MLCGKHFIKIVLATIVLISVLVLKNKFSFTKTSAMFSYEENFANELIEFESAREIFPEQCIDVYDIIEKFKKSTIDYEEIRWLVLKIFGSMSFDKIWSAHYDFKTEVPIEIRGKYFNELIFVLNKIDIYCYYGYGGDLNDPKINTLDSRFKAFILDDKKISESNYENLIKILETKIVKDPEFFKLSGCFEDRFFNFQPVVVRFFSTCLDERNKKCEESFSNYKAAGDLFFQLCDDYEDSFLTAYELKLLLMHKRLIYIHNQLKYNLNIQKKMEQSKNVVLGL